MSSDNTIRQLAIGFVDLMAGSAGGVSTVLVGQPLDTIKVKMQTFPQLYKNTINCFKQTVVKDGFKGLYAGTAPALAANVAENSVLFCAYGFCQQTVCYVRQTQKCSPIDNAIAGFLAAFFSSFTLCPTELIKCKLQAMREMGLNTNFGSVQLTRQILREEGIPGMFRGLTSTMAREMPGYFFFFGGYEMAKNMLRTDPEEENVGLLKTIIAGGFGGTCLWASIFPFDVVKSRIQVESSREKMITVLLKILRTEGIRGLYNGLTPTLLRTFPSTGALFVAYETSKEFMTSVVDKTLI